MSDVATLNQTEIDEYAQFLEYKAWKSAKDAVTIPAPVIPDSKLEPEVDLGSVPPPKPPKKTATGSSGFSGFSGSSGSSRSSEIPEVSIRKARVLEAIATIESTKKDASVSLIRLFVDSNYPNSGMSKTVGSICTSLVNDDFICVVPAAANRARKFRLTEMGQKFLGRMLYLKKLPS